MEPGLKESVGAVGGRKIVAIYLLFEDGGWEVDEEAWAGRAGAAPEYVRGLGIIPFCGFADYTGCFRG